LTQALKHGWFDCMAHQAAIHLEAQRYASLRAFLASRGDVEIGYAQDCPLPPEQLAKTTPASSYVTQTHSGGLTAMVYRIQIGGQVYALKVRRPQALVQNFDGETSFLNELLRRQEIAQLAARDAWPAHAHVTPTLYASWRHGILLTPWIESQPVYAWNARQLTQAFAAGAALIESGMFEWDFSSGNVLDDGQSVWLFDLGYCYRFDPLTQFNSAGTGQDEPLFHLIERFETRNLSAQWLQIEQEQGLRAVLDAFAQVKHCACICYENLGQRLTARGAQATVLVWLNDYVTRWRTALLEESALYTQYLVDAWRAHLLDVEDDLRGRICTALTLRRLDWLTRSLNRHGSLLEEHQAFFWADKTRSTQERLNHLESMRAQAVKWQAHGDTQQTVEVA
jgi:hypothetical protein